MQRKIIWGFVALVLIAAPAAIGLIALRGDDGSSEARRAGALIQAGTGGGGQLTIDGITPPGQAIEIESWSWEVDRQIITPTATTSKREAGAPQVSEIKVVKKADAVSPKLMLATLSGQPANATLKLYKAGSSEKPQEYLVIELKQVLISGFKLSGTGGDNPSENISLNFTEISFATYDATGQKVQPATYNLTTLKAL